MDKDVKMASSTIRPTDTFFSPGPGLRRFSKLTCLATLLLIFVGGMVTSTGSGLSVPDWPLSYGMVFPPMVGGVFYEHGHRMVATLVGFLVLCLAIWLGRREPRRWVRNLGFGALAAVICQGLLGGLTVLFFLPTPISVAHGVLAQTFFILTIIIAYSQSIERHGREFEDVPMSDGFIKISFAFTVLVYVQLILGAWMRHSGSGLAIPDFPTMGGYWLPPFNQAMLNAINDWRFAHNLDPVAMNQVVIHFAHRLGALTVAIGACLLTWGGLTQGKNNKQLVRTVVLLDSLVLMQILLGILTVLTGKAPVITSIHVVTGAAVLGVSVLLLLRAAPLSMARFCGAFVNRNP